MSKSAWCNRWRGANLFAVRETNASLQHTLTELHNSTQVDTYQKVMIMHGYKLGHTLN